MRRHYILFCGCGYDGPVALRHRARALEYGSFDDRGGTSFSIRRSGGTGGDANC